VADPAQEVAQTGMGRTRRERSLHNRPERRGIVHFPDLEPIIAVALRPEVLRRDKDASARPEYPRQRNRPVASRSSG